MTRRATAADSPGSALIELGMSASEAAAKATLFGECTEAIRPFGERPSRRLFVPGRVEFLGKHTDYAGGRSLLCTVQRGFCLAILPSTEPALEIMDVHRSDRARIPLDVHAQGTPGHWSTYAAAVARRMALNFPGATKGCRIAFASDLPVAAGLSSSSALLIGVFLSVAAENDLQTHPAFVANIASLEELAGYLGSVENGSPFKELAGERGVGTFGGSEDHTAILCCQAGRLAQYGFVPVALERTLAWPDDYRLLIASSGVVAEKTAAAREFYNRASLSVRALLEIWNSGTGRRDPSLAAAIASSVDAYSQLTRLIASARHRDFSREELHRRLDQFMQESNTIIPEVGDKIASGSTAAIGPAVDLSQLGAEQQLTNQVPETIFLARSARTLGAVASSSFGAGWGGSVWALVEAAAADTLLSRWQEDYFKAFPNRASAATFFSTMPGPAATWLCPAAAPLGFAPR